ncbi:MAG: ATP-binding protein [Armatimonadota bacterium]|nr:ATP-binding protein [Armatimonadota bacterium]
MLLLPDNLQVYWATQAIADALGYSRNELLQKTLYELVAASAEQLNALLASSSHSLDLTMYRQDREERTFRATAQLLSDYQLLLLQLVDITDLYLPLKALRSVSTISPQQTGLEFISQLFVRVSQALGTAHVYLGRLATPEQVEGILYAVGGELRAPFNYVLHGTPCADVVTQGVCFFPRNVQALFPEDRVLQEMGIESYIGAPLHDPQGRVIGIFWIADTKPLPELPSLTELFRVITVRATHELLRDQAEREAQQLREQLFQAQKMESIGRMAGGIAHDFNNLLTAVLGYVELAQGALPENSPAQAFLNNAIVALERAAGVARQLMTLARQQPMQRKILNLNTVVEEAIQLARAWMPSSIHLQTALAEDLWLVEADQAQLVQVVQNLLLNARDAIPDARGVITIETQNVVLDIDYARRHIEVVPGEYVMLAISDTGVGMSPEVQARIFEPFFTTKPSGQGIGLGLSVVYSVVKQLGGHIWVYSEQGKGSTFKIYLPRASEATVVQRAVAAEAGPLPRGQETILLVEDQRDVLQVAAEALRQHGYTVLTASTPAEALQIANEHQGQIHLLITDVVMPVMSGRELAEYLVRLHPKMRVLYVSGYTENIISHHGVVEPGIHFLSKPYTPSRLVRKVREVLESEPSA